MQELINEIDFLQIVTILGVIIATLFVFIERQKWVRYSQGLKPLLLGLLLFAVILIIKCLRMDCSQIDSIKNFLLVRNSANFGLVRLISLSYIVTLCGIEILCVVFLKNLNISKRLKDSRKNTKI